MSSLDADSLEIIASLLARSRKGEVHWQPYDDPSDPAPEGGDDYIVNLAEYSVNVWFTGNVAGFSILDSNAHAIILEKLESHEIAYEDIQDLVRIARAHSRGLPRALRQIKEELAKEGPIGKKKSDDDLPL